MTQYLIMSKVSDEQFCPKDQSDWRSWLAENHQSSASVWLIYYKVSSPKHNLSWSDAVDEALCFGWIDSVRRKVDDERFKQLFTKRKPGSSWSKINKDKVKALEERGLMREAGLQSIEVAKQNGAWTMMDQVDQLVVPEDLEKAFAQAPDAREFFQNLSVSKKKMLLVWLVMAKRDSTRQNRIETIVKCGSQWLMPKQLGG